MSDHLHVPASLLSAKITTQKIKLHVPKLITLVTHFCWGHAVAQFVEALRYKSEGRGFDSRWCH
jgi:hypothetical protein